MKTKTENVGVRMNSCDKEILEKVCEQRGEGISDFIRRSIKKELASLNYYPQETKKALGMG